MLDLLLDERKDLVSRLEKLRDFQMNEDFKKLPPEDTSRIGRQAYYMALYANVLDERIKAFKE